MSEKRYFGKDNFTGNRLHKAYKNDGTIVETFLKRKISLIMEKSCKY